MDLAKIMNGDFYPQISCWSGFVVLLRLLPSIRTRPRNSAWRYSTVPASSMFIKSVAVFRVRCVLFMEATNSPHIAKILSSSFNFKATVVR